MMARRLVLPLPERPTRATRSPRATVRERRERTLMSPKDSDRLEIEIAEFMGGIITESRAVSPLVVVANCIILLRCEVGV